MRQQKLLIMLYFQMSESCRELRRDLTTHSHQSSTILREVPRCQKQPDAHWEECHEYSGIPHTGLDMHQNPPKTKRTLLFFFHAASQLPISHRAASYKLLLKMTFNWNDFFERWQKIFSSCCSPLWSCVWFCLVCTLSLVGFALCVCRTRLWDILLHWPRLLTNTVMWIKLHEIEAEQLEKGFEDFFKIWCRINWPPWTTMP